MARSLLVVGGLDPAGCSGLAADLRAAAAVGVHAAPVAATLTVQDTRAVSAVHPVDPALLAEQVRAVRADLRPDAVKVGLLASAAGVEALGEALAGFDAPRVVDPVVAASTGARLADEATVAALRVRLIPGAALITPNLAEAEALTGLRVHDAASTIAAGRALRAMGAAAALLKGGHADPPGSDVLVTAAGVTRFEGAAIHATHPRGTGCTLATAIAAHLALGATLHDAVARARALVRAAIEAGIAIGHGPGPAVARRVVGRLHVLTDDVTVAQEAVAGGADLVQYREKRPLSTQRLVATARDFAALGVPCVVNDRVDVAAVAHGVHLGREDLDPVTARRLLGPAALIGVTVHSVWEARRAFDLWAGVFDYVGAGPVFGTRSKAVPAPDLGLDALAAIVKLAPVPVVAIGSITPQRVAAVRAAGAHGIAVLSGVADAPDRRAAVARYVEALAGDARGWA